MTVTEKKLKFSAKEWSKIEKLRTRGRGKTFASAKEAAAELKSL